MSLPGPLLLGAIFLIFEVLLGVTRRSRGDGERKDRSTLPLLWIVISCSIVAAMCAAIKWHDAQLSPVQAYRAGALILFVAGLSLRWWAIHTLGRFFTVDVDIARDHELVEQGPFRYLRHPSYTGVLLAFVAFGLSLANWAAFLVLMIPILIAFGRRINVEEQALAEGLGERYRSYMQRTKRLIPGVY
ncbi:MAG: isoprenylcysteine carboxylmethyltransferase family protein [Chthoniobacterales bacterium]